MWKSFFNYILYWEKTQPHASHFPGEATKIHASVETGYFPSTSLNLFYCVLIKAVLVILPEGKQRESDLES